MTELKERAIKESQKQKYISYLFLIFLILFSDQITKQIVKASISPYEVKEILPFLNLVYVENRGSAFGLFASMGKMFFISFNLFAIFLLVILFLKDKENKHIYSLLIGGALGNLMDRVQYGYVIDFIDIFIGNFHWPAFNIADISLTIGIFLLLYKTIWSSRQR